MKSIKQERNELVRAGGGFITEYQGRSVCHKFCLGWNGKSKICHCGMCVTRWGKRSLEIFSGAPRGGRAFLRDILDLKPIIRQYRKGGF